MDAIVYKYKGKANLIWNSEFAVYSVDVKLFRKKMLLKHKIDIFLAYIYDKILRSQTNGKKERSAKVWREGL